MTLLLALVLLAAPPDTLATLYAQKNAPALARLQAAPSDPAQDLLVRYRLYPLTQDARVLRDLPDESACRSARDLALLAALWAFRAAEAPPWKLPFYGTRHDRLLRRALALDPEDPYVLLVEGQSLLFRPAVFGGDAEAALKRFEALRAAIRQRPVDGISPFEPDVWVWYTLRRLGRPNTDRMKERLLAQDPPPLFREFLQGPP